VRRPRLRLVRVYPEALGPLLLVAMWLPDIAGGAFRVDTGVYAAVGHWSWASGDPTALSVGEVPYFNKPPLALWVHGLFLHALGVSLWAARLPSLLVAILATWSAARAARLLAGPGAATATGLVLATTLEFFRYTRAISLDLWMAGLLAAALVPAASAVRHGRPSRLLLAGVWIGLALLVKPLAALLAPLALAAWLVWIGRARWLGWLAGATGIALAIAAPWHAAMIARFGDEFTTTYFLKQSIGRATGETFEPEPIWYFPALLLRTYWPWLAVLAAAAWSGVRRASPPDRVGRLHAERLAWCVAGVWLIGLSLFAAKHTRYLVPAYPALAIACALWLRYASPGWARIATRAAERWVCPAVWVGAAVALVVDVRVHGDPEPHIGSLDVFLKAHAGETLWTTSEPEMRSVSCDVYLLSRRWPRAAPIAPDVAASIGLAWAPPPGDGPAAGDLVLLRRDAALAPRAIDETVWSSPPLEIVRLGSPFGGGASFTR
jgi:4-amino-4-deoxy-L-arabinose transferase-like glycosyltransferase